MKRSKTVSKGKLTKAQKEFIRAKVRALGSIKQVKYFYRRDSLVTKYAHEYADRWYSERKPLTK